MAKDPWTDPHPQPGEFDDELDAIDPRDVQVVEAGSGGNVTNRQRRGRERQAPRGIASERDQGVDQVVADLVRNA